MCAKLPVALVTGGGSGMGREIALRLADDQLVLIAGRDSAALDATKALGVGRKNAIVPLQIDLAAPDAATKIQAELDARGVRVSSLILNAATWKSAPIESLSQAEIANMFAVNVLSVFELVKLVLPEMKSAKGGTIVFNTGIVGLKGYAGDSAYCATKHAQIGLMRALGAEVSRSGITVASIVSGFVDGSRTDQVIQAIANRKKISTAEARKVIENAHPQKRIIAPAEIAELAAKLCSGGLQAVNGDPLVLSHQ